MKAEWIGLREATRALKRLPEDVRFEVQETANVTAFQVWNHANRSVAVLTGRLKSRLKWAARPRSLSAVVGVDGTDAHYWKFVEYGTVKMDAQPFLRPAADALRDDHQRRLIQALEKARTQMERG